MLTGIVENHPHGTLADFRGILVRCFAHDAPSYSRVGASGNPGAVQSSSPIWISDRCSSPHGFLLARPQAEGCADGAGVKRAGTSTVARNVSATSGPMAGTVMNRRATSSWRANRKSMSSNRLNCSRRERLANSNTSVTGCRSVSASSSSYRGSKSRAFTLSR